VRHYIDFEWQTEGGARLPPLELESWESIIREAVGGSGWVVMRLVGGMWQVDEAKLTRADGASADLAQRADRRDAVKKALRQAGKATR
jgi:hypothetical protein